MSIDAELAIVGAGPHALTMACFLVDDGLVDPARLCVLDPSGGWMAGGHQRFRAHRIEHLRSPLVHHPAPGPFAFARFAGADERLVTRTHLPTTRGFDLFCEGQVEARGLQKAVRRAFVRTVRPRPDGAIVLELDGRPPLACRRVVLATNPATPVIPGWARGTPAVRHAEDIDLDRLGSTIQGAHVVVIGGRLTVAHLVIGAVEAGAHVTVIHRRRLRAQPYDADPGWLGPKLLRGFENRDLRRRRAVVDSARNGGSLTAAALRSLREHRDAGRVLICQHEQVTAARPQAQGLRLTLAGGGGGEVDADAVWLATGSRLDAGSDPVLADLLASHPLEIFDGLPALDESLRWAGLPVHLTGGYAALRVGPVARNLAGARKAAKRIRLCVAAQRVACTDIPDDRQEHQWTTPRTATTTS